MDGEHILPHNLPRTQTYGELLGPHLLQVPKWMANSYTLAYIACTQNGWRAHTLTYIASTQLDGELIYLH